VTTNFLRCFKAHAYESLIERLNASIIIAWKSHMKFIFWTHILTSSWQTRARSVTCWRTFQCLQRA
jgi:hypothetical protein